jgi:hypothetical protein
MRICERCRRAFECAAANTLRFCKTCAIVLCVSAAPHDLPHNHNETGSHHSHFARITVTASTATSTATSTASASSMGTIVWHIPPPRE